MKLSPLQHNSSITMKMRSGWVPGETRNQDEVDAFCAILSSIDGCRLSDRRKELSLVSLPSAYHSWRMFDAATRNELCSGWGSARTTFNAFGVVSQIAFDLRFRIEAWRSVIEANERIHDGVLDLLLDADLAPRPIGKHGLPDYSDYVSRPFGWNPGGEA